MERLDKVLLERNPGFSRSRSSTSTKYGMVFSRNSLWGIISASKVTI